MTFPKIDNKLIEGLIQKAHDSPRRRASAPLHDDQHPGPQALRSAILPGSYVRPHKHRSSSELWIYLQGSIYVPTFDEQGDLIDNVLMGPGSEGSLRYFEVPQFVYHGAIAVRNPAITIHINQGPHNQKTYMDHHPLAPDEKDTANVPRYFDELRRRVMGSQYHPLEL